MRITNLLSIAAVIGMGVISCTKVENLPARPEITYESFQVFDTVDILGNTAKGGLLVFKFQDGDGDLGLATPSNLQSDTTNLILRLYRKVKGEMVPAPDNDPLKPSGFRIPYMSRPGQNQVLRGTITVTFMYLFYSPGDTIQYDFYIKDRADHISNIEKTAEIAISVNNIYTN